MTDLGLATERRDAQVQANTGQARNPHLIGTARFASINSHIGVGKYDVLASCRTKIGRMLEGEEGVKTQMLSKQDLLTNCRLIFI